MTRFVLVEIDATLPDYRRVGIWCAIKQIPGVHMLTDLEAVSQATLDQILLKPTPAVERRDPSTYNAIRQYHRRKRQPALPLPPEGDAA